MIHTEQQGKSCSAVPRWGQPVSKNIYIYVCTGRDICQRDNIYSKGKMNIELMCRLLSGAICMKQQKGMSIPFILVGLIKHNSLHETNNLK